MRKLLFPASLVLLVAAVGLAIAQSNPGLKFGQVPTAAEWNAYFASKVDVSGYIPASRATLSGPTTFFVDGINGNDANGCLASGTGACKTIQAAVNLVASKYDLACNDVTIQLAGTGGTPQTYTGNLVVPALLGACDVNSLTITGDTTTPANVTLTAASGSVITVGPNSTAPSSSVSIQGFTISGAGVANGVQVVDGGTLRISGNMTFGAVSGSHLTATRRAYINIISGYSITGGGSSHINVLQNSMCNNGSGLTVTLSGTPSFSNAFIAFVLNASSNMASPITFSGSATGLRYSAGSGAIINTGGQGPNYFPGNSAGVTSTGGQYL